jgi:hypothetical protein
MPMIEKIVMGPTSCRLPGSEQAATAAISVYQYTQSNSSCQGIRSQEEDVASELCGLILFGDRNCSLVERRLSGRKVLYVQAFAAKNSILRRNISQKMLSNYFISVS